FIIGDPMRRDRYMQTATQRSHEPSFDEAYYRFVIGDRAGLRTLVDDGSATVANRAAALNYLTKLGDSDSAFIHRRFEDLINASGDFSVASEYSKYLTTRGEAAIEEREMRRIFAKRADSADPIWKAWV